MQCSVDPGTAITYGAFVSAAYEIVPAESVEPIARAKLSEELRSRRHASDVRFSAAE